MLPYLIQHQSPNLENVSLSSSLPHFLSVSPPPSPCLPLSPAVSLSLSPSLSLSLPLFLHPSLSLSHTHTHPLSRGRSNRLPYLLDAIPR